VGHAAGLLVSPVFNHIQKKAVVFCFVHINSVAFPTWIHMFIKIISALAYTCEEEEENSKCKQIAGITVRNST
jgi:hypothetical protein